MPVDGPIGALTILRAIKYVLAPAAMLSGLCRAHTTATHYTFFVLSAHVQIPVHRTAGGVPAQHDDVEFFPRDAVADSNGRRLRFTLQHVATKAVKNIEPKELHLRRLRPLIRTFANLHNDVVLGLLA